MTTNHTVEETVAARELRIYFRARALCASAEPHEVDRRPCPRHEREAREQLREARA